MNRASIAFLLCAVAPARADSGWAYLPASRQTHTLGVIPAAWSPQEDAVRLVGARGPNPPAMAETRRVVAVDLPDPRQAVEAGRPAAAPVADAIPEGARWPDAGGAIAAAATDPADAREKPATRNPWEVRVRPKAGRQRRGVPLRGDHRRGRGRPRWPS
jgi:hypothetical protein